MSKSFLVLNERVIVWFPRVTRECRMLGFRWRNNFIGMVMGGEPVDPKEEAYYEVQRRIAKQLEKPETNRVSIREN